MSSLPVILLSLCLCFSLPPEVTGNQWLLEQSIVSKPIYSLRDEVRKSESQCQALLYEMLKNTFNTSWSHPMLDANAGLPSGLLEDQFSSVGDYKECLRIHQFPLSSNPFRGQYCFLTFTQSNQSVPTGSEQWIDHTKIVNRRYPYAFGLCVPNVCSKDEIRELFQNSTEFGKSGFQNIQVQFCQVNNEHESYFETLKKWDTIFVFPALVSICSIVLIGTFYEIFFSTNPNHWILKFSAVRNTKTLFIHNENSPGSLQARLSPLHGVRALAMIWIVFGHNSAYFPGSILAPLLQLGRHPFDYSRMVNNSIIGALLNNGYHAVETFFYLSGFLMVAVLIDKKFTGRVTFAQFWGLRYLRFALPLTGLIILHKCLFMIAAGPFNTPEIFYKTYPACKDRKWWKHMLFFNNLVYPWESCIYFSWFLSADLQINMLAFLLIVALRRQLYRRFYALCIFFASFTIIFPVGVILAGVPTFDTIQFFVDYSVEPPQLPQILLYTAPYIHMCSFFFGAAMGLALMQNRKFFFSTSKFWYSIALVSLTVTAFSRMPSVETLGGSHLARGAALFGVFGSWIVAANVVIHQMAQHDVPSHTLLFRKFLSASAFRPISRLSFSIYLSQLTVSNFNFVISENLFTGQPSQMIRFTLSNTVQTIFLGWVLYILFECPINNFIREAFLGRQKASDKPEGPSKVEDLEEMKNLNELPAPIINNNHISIT